MKKRMCQIAVIAFAIIGCQKTEIGNYEKITVASDFRGEVEGLLETKTTLDKNNNVRWSEGDQVIIFNGSTLGGKYQITEDSVGETSAGFEYIEDAVGGFVSGSDIDHNIAFYPFSSKVKCAKGDDKEPTESYELTKISIPSVQQYCEDSFGQETFPMVAVTSSVSDYRLTFKNVLGGMKLQLKGVCTVASITVKGHAEEPLAGTAGILAYVDGSAPELFLNDDAVTSVSLDCGNDGVELNAEIPTDFIIALPPTVFKSGFSVVIKDVKGDEMTVKTSKENVVYRSSLLRMPVIDVTLSAYEKPRLSLIETETILSSDSGTFAVSVDANVEYEVVMPEVEWIRLGESKDSVESFVVDANEDYEDRFADIVFRNVEHGLQSVFNVRQMQKNAIIVAKPEYEIDIAGGSVSIEIQTNVDFDISIAEDAQEWISLVETRSLESKSLTFSIAPCASDIERTGLITFAKDTLEQTVKITQYDLKAGEAIVFADDQVKAACVAKFDANGDGELSYREAAAVESISGVSFPNTITSFDEFQYFTGVTSVPASRFESFGELTSITLPESVTRIENRAFYYCTKLCKSPLTTNVVYIGASAFGNCTTMTGPGIFNPLVEIKNYAFNGCSSLSDDVVIPGTATLSYQIFKDCVSLVSVVIESGQTSIQHHMFSGCINLRELIIPETITVIDKNACYGCSSLTELKLPPYLKTIGAGAFEQCKGLKSLTIPGTVKEFGSHAFSYCTNLEQLILSEGIEYVGSWGFEYNSKLQEVEIPSTVTHINNNAFQGCTSLSEVTIPSSVVGIANQAFAGCTSLLNVALPNSVISIGGGAFDSCSGLITVSLSESLQELGGNAFRSCKSLKYIDLPASLSLIGDGVFQYCSSLESIRIPDNITALPVVAFAGCTSLKEVKLSDFITTIGAGAFRDCAALNDITLPKSLVEIGDNAFRGTSLISLKCPDGLEKIGGGVFYGCKTLESIEFSESLLSIGGNAFCECDGLTGEINLPESLTWLGSDAFAWCDGFSSLVIGGSDLSFGNGSFFSCTALKSITFRDGGTYDFFINDFSDCSNLTSVVLPDGLTEITSCMFRDCYKLSSVIIPDSVETIGDLAFGGCDIKEMQVLALVPPVLGSNRALGGSGFLGIIYVPAESLDAYKEAWSQYADQIVAI